MGTKHSGRPRKEPSHMTRVYKSTYDDIRNRFTDGYLMEKYGDEDAVVARKKWADERNVYNPAVSFADLLKWIISKVRT